MSILAEAIGMVAPYYNLVFVIVVIILMTRLCQMKSKKVFLEPWKYMYLAVLVFVIEEILVVLNALGLFSYPRIINALFELVIIALFIYALLLQKQFVMKKYKK